MAQMTWFSPRMALFGVRTISDIIWGKCAPKTPQRGVNRQTSIIFKLTYLGRGSSDFDENWHGDTVRPSWPLRTLKISNFENPRWRQPPSWQIEKSPYLGRNCDEILHSDAVWPSKKYISKIQRWSRPPSWISTNRDISATVVAISTKCGIVMMQCHPLDRSGCWKI